MKRFKDKVRILLTAGRGGDGKVSFFKGRKPIGGIGGNGGNIYLEGSATVYDLNSINADFSIKAEDGVRGGDDNLKGRNGKDTIIKVPLTTRIFNQSGDLIATVSRDREMVKILSGGEGGLGNYFYRTKGLDKLERADEGKPGESLDATFMLELYSDVLLLGLPNAGKSSLLNSITNADSKVANYAFTTLNPQLGRMDGIVIMDLPGLIEGTFEGKGVGTEFVKHTISARLILHLVSCESEDPLLDYDSIRAEIKKIDKDLFKKEEIILLSKTDLITPERLAEYIAKFEKSNKKVITISNYDLDALEELKELIKNKLKS